MLDSGCIIRWLAGYLLSFFSLQKLLDSLHHLLHHLHSIHCSQLFSSGYLKVAIYHLLNGSAPLEAISGWL